MAAQLLLKGVFLLGTVQRAARASRNAVASMIGIADGRQEQMRRKGLHPTLQAGVLDACRRCLDCQQLEDDSYFGRGEDYVFECMTCPEDSVILDGPPVGYQAPAGLVVKVISHCGQMGGSEKTVLMLRHGQSEWNHMMEASHKVAGLAGLSDAWKDSPLSSLGLRQAQRLSQILRKADAALHPNEEAALPNNIQRVVDEQQYTDLEGLVRIVDKSRGGAEVTDAEAVTQLTSHPEELDVLSGRRCGETTFVSSQLARAMDTLLVATSSARSRCDADWEISSNMQEIEHNADCDARTEPGTRPSIGPTQMKPYIASQMEDTMQFVQASYAKSNVSRFTKNYGKYERMRIFDQSEQMVNETEHVFASASKYTVMGGHSIWFRHFFKAFGDRQDPVCKELTRVKIANTGLVAATMRELPGESQRFVATKCRYIYLGSSDNFKLKVNSAAHTQHIPVHYDFRQQVKDIMGWRCCCSRENEEGLQVGHQYFSSSTPKFYGSCLIVRTPACKRPKEWEEVHGKEAGFITTAAQYFWRSSYGAGQFGFACRA